METNEVNPCNDENCKHGRERHSEKRAGDTKSGRSGKLCLISTCPCYNFQKSRNG